MYAPLHVHCIQDDLEDDDEEGSLKDFIDDDETTEESGGSDSDVKEVDEAGEEKKRVTRGDKVGTSVFFTFFL